jgi:carbon monoxide dehydrogenase subunit G
MPQREAKFAVNAGPAELWRFIRDFESLCSCIPGVEHLRRVDNWTVELTVKEKVGVVPLIVNLRARIESEDPPRNLHAVARAEHLTMEIDVALRGVGSGTELVALFKVAGEGPLKPVVDRLFERRATERAAQFADCLAKHFGADSSREPQAELQARPGPARDWSGRFGRWFVGVWRRVLEQSRSRGK